MMECGHSANSESNGTPACVICAGISGGANLRVADAPDLTGRLAKCHYRVDGGKERGSRYDSALGHSTGTSSRLDLPFFQHCPNAAFDTYYCGCWGWH